MKQIVGGSLQDGAGVPRTNHVSEHPPAWFAELYRRDHLNGGHIILLGPGNEAAARQALDAWPGGLQLGGGVTIENAESWLDAGASHVIVTSWIFKAGRVHWYRLSELMHRVGRERLVVDLSCRKRDGRYFVVTDRWQKFTDLEVTPATLKLFAGSCAEFLIHAVDVEGLCNGIDGELVSMLGQHTPLPTTYAGGAKSLEDLERVQELGRGRVDLTIGSALDIFGGTGVRYKDAVEFNRRPARPPKSQWISHE